MYPIAFKYGLIAGLILTGMVVTMMLMIGETSNFERGESVRYLFIVSAFSMIYLGIRQYRDKKLGGTISFNIAFRTGLLITIIASTCYAIAWLVYFNFIDESFTERYTTFMIDKIKTGDKTPEEIENEIKLFTVNMADYKKPGVMGLYTFLEIFPIGLVISILCGMLMKRKSGT
jgi:hypothetical protein